MAETVIFTFQHTVHTISFKYSKAVLPVKLKNGACKLVTWGRREHENSEMPLGGWARLSAVKNGHDQKWHLYQPKPVQVFVDKFMERDFEGIQRWYEVTQGKCLQGLLAQHDNEYRLYIVTIEPDDLMNCHYKWPHIITCAIKPKFGS